MTVKEFLNDVRRQHARVEACKERLKEIECEVISLKSPQLGDKIQSNSVKSLDEVICRLELKRAETSREFIRLMDMQDKAETLISCEKDHDRWSVLYRRYILNQKWEKIAAEINLDLRWIYRLHGQGLVDLENTPLKATIDM
uniref:DUF1492 domain-containing protein n=1 Tax=Siphoviridae sp. ctsMn4 TaxID=2826485 RepID=A0A8S5NK93_9CAUD|nr:MAG TPA: Protein of unknown function (DUF1492) [Siphoviridae sp. ctsMn4]